MSEDLGNHGNKLRAILLSKKLESGLAERNSASEQVKHRTKMDVNVTNVPSMVTIDNNLSAKTKVFAVTKENDKDRIRTETFTCSSAETNKFDSVAVVTNAEKSSKDVKDLPGKMETDDMNTSNTCTCDVTQSHRHGEFQNGGKRKGNICMKHDSLGTTSSSEKELDQDSKDELSDHKEQEESDYEAQDKILTEDDMSDLSSSETHLSRQNRKDNPRKSPKRKRRSPTKSKSKRKKTKTIKVKMFKKSVAEEEKTKVASESKKKRRRKGKKKSDEMKSTEENRFQCHVCGKFLKSTSAVIVHQRIHTGEKPFQCTICNKSFSVKVSLSRHIRTHTGEKPYICSFCKKAFGQAASLKRHLGQHTGNYPFKCHLCEKRYIQHSDLLGHLRSHSGMKREKTWVCEVCGSAFVSTRNLVRHVKWVHIADKPFVCDICGKGFIELAKLTAHQRYHTGERPYKCPMCQRGFVDKGYLREHMKIHEDREKKTFKCEMCEKGFSTSKNLYRHVRTIHTKEEVYTCNICWKNFGQAGNLKIHRLRHHRDLADSDEFLKAESNVEEDDDDIYETYICERNKVYAEKLSPSGSDHCVNDIENKNLAAFINLSSKSILEKFGFSTLKGSSEENLS